MLLRALVFCLLLVFAHGDAHAQASGSGNYRLSLRMVLDGQIIGTPEVVVAPGRPAIVSVDRDGGYSLVIQAGARSSRIEVTADIYRRNLNRWNRLATPSLTMNLGASAVYELSPARGGGVRQPAFRMEVSVAAAPVAASLDSVGGRSCSETDLVSWQAAMDNLQPLTVRRTSLQEGPPSIR